MECSFWGVWDSVGNAEKWLALFFLLEEIGLESNLSTIWNTVPTCLMWLVWQERNTRTFEDSERPLDLLKSLLFGTLFQWVCMYCISIFEFLQSTSFSS